MPSPGDNCGNCFFAMTVPADAATNLVGLLSCNYNAPPALPREGAWPWPIVATDWWCGVGCNETTGTPFNAAAQPITPTSGATTSGVFNLTTNPQTITDAACKATSRIAVWWITCGTPNAPGLTAVPGAGSFVVSFSGSATGTCGYTIYN
jgi:hypothetical protein